MFPYQSFPTKAPHLWKASNLSIRLKSTNPHFAWPKRDMPPPDLGWHGMLWFQVAFQTTKQWKPLTHNKWKNYTFKMQTQDESEAQILTGHTVVAVGLWVALQINVQFTYQVHHVHPGNFLRHGYQKALVQKVEHQIKSDPPKTWAIFEHPLISTEIYSPRGLQGSGYLPHLCN